MKSSKLIQIDMPDNSYFIVKRENYKIHEMKYNINQLSKRELTIIIRHDIKQYVYIYKNYLYVKNKVFYITNKNKNNVIAIQLHFIKNYKTIYIN